MINPLPNAYVSGKKLSFSLCTASQASSDGKGPSVCVAVKRQESVMQHRGCGQRDGEGKTPSRITESETLSLSVRICPSASGHHQHRHYRRETPYLATSMTPYCDTYQYISHFISTPQWARTDKTAE